MAQEPLVIANGLPRQSLDGGSELGSVEASSVCDELLARPRAKRSVGIAELRVKEARHRVASAKYLEK